MTYINPISVTACGILFPVLGAIAVALRFRTRRARKLELRTDDWICLPALAFLWAEGGLLVAGAATHSFGWHSPTDVTLVQFLNDDEPSVRILGKLQTAFDLMHPIALGLLKVSICFFYRRMFCGRKFDIVSRIVIGIIVVWAVAFFIAIATACGTHFEANWASLGVLKQECVDTFRLLLSYTVTDVAVDLVLIIVPIPLIFGLQMPLGRKFSVCGAILIGALAIACGITRMVLFIEVDAPSFLGNARVAGLLSTDDIGVVSLFVFWGMLELGVGMIAICLPTIRPLLWGWSPESVMRSIRSALSLHSMNSGGGRRGQHLGSQSSIAGFELGSDLKGEVGTERTITRRQGDQDSLQRAEGPLEGKIRVRKDFEVSDAGGRV